MNNLAFDALARNAAAAVSRRASLLTLGGAGLVAAMAHPQLAGAGKAGKKAKKKCKKQVGQCRDNFTQHCAVCCSDTEEEFDLCFATFAACCEPLAQCNAAATFACLEGIA